MTDDIRQNLIEQNHVRKAQRQSLQNNLSQAKRDLHPRNIANRWVMQKKVRLADAAKSTKQNLEKKAPLIGIAGIVVLLFTARKPISRLWMGVRNRTQDKEPQNEQAG